MQGTAQSFHNAKKHNIQESRDRHNYSGAAYASREGAIYSNRNGSSPIDIR